MHVYLHKHKIVYTCAYCPPENGRATYDATLCVTFCTTLCASYCAIFCVTLSSEK